MNDTMVPVMVPGWYLGVVLFYYITKPCLLERLYTYQVYYIPHIYTFTKSSLSALPWKCSNVWNGGHFGTTANA